MSRTGWFICIILALLLITGIVLAIVFGVNASTSGDSSCNRVQTSASLQNIPQKNDDNSKETEAHQKADDTRPKTEAAAAGLKPVVSANSEPKGLQPCESCESCPLDVFHQTRVSGVGSSLSIHPESGVMIVGIPGSDRGFGSAQVFQLHKDLVSENDEDPEEPIQAVRQVKFGVSGSAFQKAGYRVRGSLVAAPDFSIHSTETVGTLFAIQEGFVIKRLAVHTPGDGYRMEDRGDVFQYHSPVLIVAKRNNLANRLDVFHWDGNTAAPKLIQSIHNPTASSRFGYSFQLANNNQQLAVLASAINTVYIYHSISNQWALDHQFDYTPLLEDQEDFNQTISVLGNDMLLISSPDNDRSLVVDFRGNLRDTLSDAAYHKLFPDHDMFVVWNNPTASQETTIKVYAKNQTLAKTWKLETAQSRIADMDWIDEHNAVLMVFDANAPDSTTLQWFKI